MSACSIEGCRRPVNAAGLCATHRRRKRLGLALHAPIRLRDVTEADVLATAYEVYDAADDDASYLTRRARFERVLERYTRQHRR